MAAPNLTLKLHIDKSSKKVRFAEASKDFVDFLFNLLHLPLGIVVRLLATEGRVGCLDKLYESVGKFTSWQCALLKPNFLVSSTVISDLLGSSGAHGGGPSSTPGYTGSVNSDPYYEVTDDLFIRPMSAHVRAGVRDEIREVELGLDKCKKLLTAFLQSKPVLTSIFEEEIRTQEERTRPPGQATGRAEFDPAIGI